MPAVIIALIVIGVVAAFAFILGLEHDAAITRDRDGLPRLQRFTDAVNSDLRTTRRELREEARARCHAVERLDRRIDRLGVSDRYEWEISELQNGRWEWKIARRLDIVQKWHVGTCKTYQKAAKSVAEIAWRMELNLPIAEPTPRGLRVVRSHHKVGGPAFGSAPFIPSKEMPI